MLINSSYFIGKRNIPNSHHTDVLSLINHLIEVNETVFLEHLLGYELFKAFKEDLLLPTPSQRTLDLLFGFEFEHCNYEHKFKGLISLTTDQPNVLVGITDDLWVTVGTSEGLSIGGTDYLNTFLAGKQYRVIQRGFGPLQPGVDVEYLDAGGFRLIRSGNTFSNGDVYNVQIVGNYISTSGIQTTISPESPIADYVYYWWQRNNVTLTSGIGEVKSTSANSTIASASAKMVLSWNDMVDKIRPLILSFRTNSEKWPEYQQRHYMSLKELSNLASPINTFNI